MSIAQLSESNEMYLKALAELSSGEIVAIGRLAERLGVTAVSANEMMRRLSEQEFIIHTPYKGVTLSEKGRQAACSVLRRQRLWECFLYDYLKIDWSRVYELACHLEHATTPEITEALAVFLSSPQTCPSGNPIPAADGTFTPLDGIALNTAALGERVRVQAVTATATEVLKYLHDRNILPGQELKIVEAAPLQGPLTLLLKSPEGSLAPDQVIVLGLSLAEFVIVKSISTD